MADTITTRQGDAVIARGALRNADAYLCTLGVHRWAIISDKTTASVYADGVLRALPHAELFTVPDGEKSKTLTSYELLCRTLEGRGFTRADGIAALGGGMVGDLAGFVAATYQRGMTLAMLPTTLLSQVDSCVGGKVGIDLTAKNQLGAFYQPRLVLVDPDALATLPERQVRSGMAEIIKYGVALDSSVLEDLEANAAWETLIGKCLRCKLALTARDERDQNERHLLNFGHTYGHAYEALGGYERFTHGEAVAAGMAQMLRFQLACGDDVGSAYERLLLLLRRHGLPEALSFPREQMDLMLRRDKKREHDTIRIAVLERMGCAALREVTVQALCEVLP